MFWTRLTRTAAPAGELISLDEIKKHLAVDFDDDDALIVAQRDAIVAELDGPRGLGMALLSQTWRLSLDCWPQQIALKFGPVTSVISVTYVDLDGVTQTLDPAQYLVDLGRDPAIIEPAYGAVFPPARAQSGAIQVTFTAGYVDPAGVPSSIIAAIKLLVGDLYANRESVVIDASRVTLVENKTAQRLLAPYGRDLA